MEKAKNTAMIVLGIVLMAAGVYFFIAASVHYAVFKILYINNIIKGRIKCYRIDHALPFQIIKKIQN